MSELIEISLRFKGHQADYRVPAGVTLARFTELMRLSVRSNGFPAYWTLELKEKDLKLVPSDILGDLPIGDGDVFEVTALKEAPEIKAEEMSEEIEEKREAGHEVI
ncbi:hypothetical protein OfM1_14690 [Lactovum odontotermitis]